MNFQNGLMCQKPANNEIFALTSPLLANAQHCLGVQCACPPFLLFTCSVYPAVEIAGQALHTLDFIKQRDFSPHVFYSDLYLCAFMCIYLNLKPPCMARVLFACVLACHGAFYVMQTADKRQVPQLNSFLLFCISLVHYISVCDRSSTVA